MAGSDFSCMRCMIFGVIGVGLLLSVVLLPISFGNVEYYQVNLTSYCFMMLYYLPSHEYKPNELNSFYS